MSQSCERETDYSQPQSAYITVYSKKTVHVTCFNSSSSLAEGTAVKQPSVSGVVGVLPYYNFSPQQIHKPRLINILQINILR